MADNNEDYDNQQFEAPEGDDNRKNLNQAFDN